MKSTKLSTSKFSFEVDDDKVHQVEIQASSENIKKYQCSCDSFKTDQECSHVFACFYSLRKLIESAAEDEKKAIRKMPAKRSRTSLRISEFLSLISERELKDFVQNYGAKDKRFSAALKSRFARKMILNNNEGVYKNILDSIIGPMRLKDQKVGSAELRNFEYVTNELISQYEDAVSLQQYTEGYYILKAILSKGCYIHHNSKKPSAKIIDLITQMHSFLDEILFCELAPELREKIFEFSTELAERSYYRILDNRLNIFEILLAHAKAKNELKIIVDTAIAKTEQIHLDETSETYLEAFIIRTHWNKDQSIIEAFYTKSLEHKSKIIDMLINLEVYLPAAEMLEKLILENARTSRFLKEKLIHVYFMSEDEKALARTVFSFFEDYNNPKYLRKLKDKLDKKWDKVKKSYVKKLESEFEDDKSNILKANFYYETDDQDELIEVFEKLTDLDTAKKLDAEIIQEYPDRVIEAYFTMSSNVLESFVGLNAATQIKQLLNHIENVSDRKKRELLWTKIKKAFEHRPQLLKDITSII